MFRLYQFYHIKPTSFQNNSTSMAGPWGRRFQVRIAVQGHVQLSAIPWKIKRGLLARKSPKWRFIAGKSSINEGFPNFGRLKYGQFVYKWGSFNCHVWLPEGMLPPICHRKVMMIKSNLRCFWLVSSNLRFCPMEHHVIGGFVSFTPPTTLGRILISHHVPIETATKSLQIL